LVCFCYYAAILAGFSTTTQQYLFVFAITQQYWLAFLLLRSNIFCLCYCSAILAGFFTTMQHHLFALAITQQYLLAFPLLRSNIGLLLLLYSNTFLLYAAYRLVFATAKSI
jgi:hypothetical protein